MQTLKLHNMLLIQVVLAILLGIGFGHFYPELAIKMKPIGDGFIKLVRMIVPPIIFSTVVIGIASMKNIKEAGRIGIKAIIYFEIVTTLSMLLGLLVANYYKPGTGLNIDVRSLDSHTITNYTHQISSFNTETFLLNIIPDTFMSAFTQGDILPVLFISILFGFGLLNSGEMAKPIVKLIEQISSIWFSIVDFIMKLSPLAAFSAMAYTIGTYGIKTLVTLSQFIIIYYLTCLFFVFVILGLIMKFNKLSLWGFLKYIKEELFIVFGVASTETVLPKMIKKLEGLGCDKSVVGLVLPISYSFNLDGMCIYLSMAVLFIAQTFNIHLNMIQQMTFIVVSLITSKGAANITGGGFIALATVVTSMHIVPIEGLVLLLGIDRFISEARSITNLIGNGVATMVIAKWEKNVFNEETDTILIPSIEEKELDKVNNASIK